MNANPEPPSAPKADPIVLRHTLLEDVQALVIGTLLVALATNHRPGRYVAQ